MKKLLTVLAAAMFVISACGGAEQSESADPPEPEQTQTEEAAPEETASGEETAPAGEESSGVSVTTIQGEEVRLGGRGEVSAMFFMAGW